MVPQSFQVGGDIQRRAAETCEIRKAIPQHFAHEHDADAFRLWRIAMLQTSMYESSSDSLGRRWPGL
jgi:hypothetical protein